MLSAYFGYKTYCSLSGYEDLRLSASVFSTLAATLFGFLITALSILVAIADKNFIVRIRVTGHFYKLVSKLFCVAGLLLLSIVSGVLALVAGDKDLVMLLISASLFFLMHSFFLFVGVGMKFKKVFEILSK
ncbi:hypothetical protein Csal_1405 [Chromohalobacter israelensis DSM 3043]|uniref:Uncharacterized protein n=1 Tax=Chromohalobacter israelensis (strain ATCC BAA-138 / DSM 3043 / CIP 106854 / NCIMB 13768 / 1H11) TaxID=290398 RepID=Q1QXP8_CHRI1|nr:hypothetical protein Csal_1405 [Chromohalobacter salexigens DSM 3043]